MTCVVDQRDGQRAGRARGPGRDRERERRRLVVRRRRGVVRRPRRHRHHGRCVPHAQVERRRHRHTRGAGALFERVARHRQLHHWSPGRRPRQHPHEPHRPAPVSGARLRVPAVRVVAVQIPRVAVGFRVRHVDPLHLHRSLGAPHRQPESLALRQRRIRAQHEVRPGRNGGRGLFRANVDEADRVDRVGRPVDGDGGVQIQRAQARQAGRQIRDRRAGAAVGEQPLVQARRDLRRPQLLRLLPVQRLARSAGEVDGRRRAPELVAARPGPLEIDVGVADLRVPGSNRVVEHETVAVGRVHALRHGQRHARRQVRGTRELQPDPRVARHQRQAVHHVGHAVERQRGRRQGARRRAAVADELLGARLHRRPEADVGVPQVRRIEVEDAHGEHRARQQPSPVAQGTLQKRIGATRVLRPGRDEGGAAGTGVQLDAHVLRGGQAGVAGILGGEPELARRQSRPVAPRKSQGHDTVLDAVVDEVVVAQGARLDRFGLSKLRGVVAGSVLALGVSHVLPERQRRIQQHPRVRVREREIHGRGAVVRRPTERPRRQVPAAAQRRRGAAVVADGHRLAGQHRPAEHQHHHPAAHGDARHRYRRAVRPHREGGRGGRRHAVEVPVVDERYRLSVRRDLHGQQARCVGPERRRLHEAHRARVVRHVVVAVGVPAVIVQSLDVGPPVHGAFLRRLVDPEDPIPAGGVGEHETDAAPLRQGRVGGKDQVARGPVFGGEREDRDRVGQTVQVRSRARQAAAGFEHVAARHAEAHARLQIRWPPQGRRRQRAPPERRRVRRRPWRQREVHGQFPVRHLARQRAPAGVPRPVVAGAGVGPGRAGIDAEIPHQAVVVRLGRDLPADRQPGGGGRRQVRRRAEHQFRRPVRGRHAQHVDPVGRAFETELRRRPELAVARARRRAGGADAGVPTGLAGALQGPGVQRPGQHVRRVEIEDAHRHYPTGTDAVPVQRRRRRGRQTIARRVVRAPQPPVDQHRFAAAGGEFDPHRRVRRQGRAGGVLERDQHLGDGCGGTVDAEQPDPVLDPPVHECRVPEAARRLHREVRPDRQHAGVHESPRGLARFEVIGVGPHRERRVEQDARMDHADRRWRHQQTDAARATGGPAVVRRDVIPLV